MVYLFGLLALMALAAFIYEYSAQYIKDECVTSISRKDALEKFGELPLDEDSRDLKIFDADKASIPITAMYVTYYISYPIRKFMGIFK